MAAKLRGGKPITLNSKRSQNLYAPGLSSLALSYFRTYLTLKFVPWVGKDNIGKSIYSKDIFLSTTLDNKGAEYFYGAAMSILNSTDLQQQIEAVLPCKNNATLILGHKPDENNQMMTCMIINKNNLTIPFIFQTRQTQVWENGKKVTKVIHAGLEDFVKILDGYLSVSALQPFK